MRSTFALAAAAAVGLTAALAYAPLGLAAVTGAGLAFGLLLAWRQQQQTRQATTAALALEPAPIAKHAADSDNNMPFGATPNEAGPNPDVDPTHSSTRKEQLRTLGDLVKQALDGRDEATLVGAVVSAGRSALCCDGCELYRTVNGPPQLAAGVGPGGIQLDRRSTTLAGSALAAEAATSASTTFEVRNEVMADVEMPFSATAVAVPIHGVDAAEGALIVRSREPRCFDEADVAFLSALAGVVALARRQRGAEQSAFRQSRHDSLTGLVNRDVFLERLATAIKQSGGDEMIAVLLADLDHFKIVNDSLGHAAGDALIQAVSERFRLALRPGDTLARLGGDEFIVLARRLGSSDQASLAAERLRSVLAEPFSIAGHAVTATASVGVAVCDDPNADPDELVGGADAALYQAKEHGRERVEVFQPSMHDVALTRLQTEEELRIALLDGQLRVLYQPIVDLGTGQTDGVEALVRWVHPRRGLVSPAEFIPISEATGLIEEVGAWVIDEVARQARAWLDADSPMSVSINLSARQLADPALLRTIDAALESHQLDGELLTVEVTERAITADADAAMRALRAIHERGIKIAIDDFGTGYTSIPHVRSLPVDTVKIDRSLVAGIDRSGEEYAIVSALVQLARVLGTRVLAEGVETEQQLDLLRDLDCDLAQGFLFSPAVFDIVTATETVSWGDPILDRR